MYLYIDAETEVSKDLTLTKMTIRQYLARAKVLSVAYALDNDVVRCALASDPGWQMHIDYVRAACAQNTVVAHNASFDVRVLTQSLGIPWPSKVHCTMEMAQGWSPNQPGGYGLDNLTRIWAPNHGKQKIDLQHCTPDELRSYNAQDVVACRALHKIALARMHPDEIRVMELTQNVKEIVFSVDQGKISDAVTAFDTQVAQHGVDAAAILGESSSYGEDDDGSIRSVKPHALRAALLETLGFDTPTISMKKINPENLRQNPDAAKVLESSAKMNKALSHKRRVRAFAGATEIDAELTYFAAHTGRWSSRNSAKGLNLHNLPKRNPAVAKPIRSLFRLPADLCFVRGDFANVEYRACGLLTQCAHTAQLFGADPLADPYAEFWRAATGQTVDKAVKADVPKRQLAKAAVLGLSYCLAEDTPVLTNHGWKAIQTVQTTDRLWDGTGWVQHGGVVSNGRKPVIRLNGIWLTAQHRVLSRSGWVEAGAIAGNELTRIPAWGRSLDDGRLLAKSTTLDRRGVSQPDVPAVITDQYGPTGSYAANQWSAVCARVHTVDAMVESPGNIPASYPTLDYGADGLLPGIISASGASLVQMPTTGTTTGGAASGFVSRIADPFSPTSSPSPDGMTGACTSTARMWTGITNPAILGWSIHQNPCETSAEVYDILDAGPANRFQAGMLLVHNCMGQQRWTHELSQSISDPSFKVTLADLEQVCAANNWTLPSDQRTRLIMGKLRCPPAVASVAFYTREKFHQVHPEFGRCARGIEQTIQRAMGMSYDQKQSQRILDSFAMMPGIVFADDRGLQGQTIRARCGPWPADTIAWRDMLIRQTPIGTGPTFVRAGNKPVAKFTINTGIENLVQSAARNALCMGLLELDRRGFPYVLHVHDEVMIVTERTCAAVNAARQSLLDVFGPGGWISRQGWEWSVLINPKETTISQSLWDDEALSQSLWPRIAAGDGAALENLT